MKLIDVSHVLEPGMPSYPGLPVPQFRTWFTHEESASRGTYAPVYDFRFFAVPPAIKGGTSFPIRAFAICK